MRAMRMASSLPLSNRTMGLIDKLKRTFVTPLVEEKEEGMAMVRSLRETGTAALAHAEALAALLKLELKEASKRLGKKTALLLMGAFMAFFGYLFLWCLLTVVMAYFWGIIAGLAVTTGFHLLAAAAGDGLQDLQHPLGALPARDALAAAFPLDEIHEKLGHVHHAGVLVHDHEAARAHHGAHGFE